MARHLVIVGTAAAAIAIAPAAALAGPPPPPTFGTDSVSLSGDSTGARMVQALVVRKPGFERIVFAFTGGHPRLSVGFVREILLPSDPPVPGQPPATLTIDGRFILGITTFESSVGPALQRRLTRGISPAPGVVRQVRLGFGFGGVNPLGAGLTARRPFRVLTLANPTRYAIDIEFP